MYILLFVLVLLVPVIMFAVGVKWRINPPAFKTGRLAYRTEATERSEEVWYFAHGYCAKLFLRYGLILAVLSTLYMVFIKSYQQYYLWVLLAQMLVFCICVFLMDMFTKNLFDENGVRIH